MTFIDIHEEIRKTKEHYVDAREYKSNWANKWVVYCDLIGFANTCLISNDTTVNSIVRFHRAVNRAKSKFPDNQIYQFTDACFCISENPFSALGFAIELGQCCLAHNAILLKDRQSVFFHHLIVPRITIASGNVLQVDGQSPEPLRNGLDLKSFLAGSAIVKAHNLEDKTFAGAIVLSGDDLFEIIKASNIRGDNTCVRHLLSRWRKGLVESEGIKDNPCIELPWPFIRRVDPNGDIWSENKFSSKLKLENLISISDKMTGDFVTSNLSITLGKHQAGLQRFIFYSICSVHRKHCFQITKFRNPKDFLDTTWPAT